MVMIYKKFSSGWLGFEGETNPKDILDTQHTSEHVCANDGPAVVFETMEIICELLIFCYVMISML